MYSFHEYDNKVKQCREKLARSRAASMRTARQGNLDSPTLTLELLLHQPSYVVTGCGSASVNTLLCFLHSRFWAWLSWLVLDIASFLCKMAGFRNDGDADEFENEIGANNSRVPLEGEGHDIEQENDDEELEDAQPWAGLTRLPERADFIELLKEVPVAGRKQLTILLLGKSSVGKSSLVNSIFGEAVVRVQAFKLQADTEITTTVMRQVAIGSHEVDGLRLKLIDTCGLEDAEAGDTVNWGALSKIAEDVRGVPIDVVLYVDRLDLYRVDALDKAIVAAITQMFGRQIWGRTILALTHANLTQPPPGTSYDMFVDGRIRLLRSIIPRGPFSVLRRPLPAVLVENSDTCPVSKVNGHRLLPDGSEWLVELMGEMVDLALVQRRPYKYHPRMTSKPSERFRWMLPLVIAAEFLFYQHLLRPALESNQRCVAEEEGKVWSLRRLQRRALGLHIPHQLNKEEAWRLEQMYDDD
nr:translocon at the outer envelope membrane of chloroplasts 34 [Volvox reticuliferus]